ncbi:arginine--tRNA ligase [Polynucleobacter paneuropaeus]|uniref:Arginine--tRNA ligase n=1 Tax=Polynucleobacter paneuropaeus TaxID=2527775 RepID=A0AAE2YL40_9BURK|nr:arginine--tRNA ligase [Polynucleobacter paneuropaeus]MBT8591407.1 arginine--tRNA ligase [Polynucleobacter paneuropaeus]MBT8596797.1 arginine--tRNA ligase [Polynucleobacter paneuropaeus]MBT8598610.1 arginine--tRNA ligase [Polynucleobacter paneuropaeus]MBT8607443.1 arginine--tRNA ligase [Polynucleobacter paneuropaeus]
MLLTNKNRLVAMLSAALNNLAQEHGQAEPPAPRLERPKAVEHGDVACNIALQIAKAWQMNPRELAQALVERLKTQAGYGALIDSCEIAGPGFINFRLSNAAKTTVIQEVLTAGEAFGIVSATANSPKAMIEFVSANPTGPLHVGHGRQAALGDALANLLATQGIRVHREFYYNDAGVQIANLALSVQARLDGLKPGDPHWPEQAYNGEYIADIAQAFKGSPADVSSAFAVDRLEAIRQFAVAYLRNEQDIDLKIFGVQFDCYYLESSLYTDGSVTQIVQDLNQVGKTYESEGALWLNTTVDGDDKNRVMRKSDGSFTYFVPDVAYHTSKWQRGFEKVINVQGSDHHGTIARVRSGLQGVAQKRGWTIPKTYPDYVLHKMVTVMRNGEEVKISKRAGSYVTVRDLVEWSGGVTDEMNEAERALALQRGRDAVRFFLISRKADTEFVFDIDLALQQNDENPVFYVQYAHARICSILQQWGGQASELMAADLSLLDSKAADHLLRRLAEYPEMLATAATELAPHALAFYLRDLAGDFHTFYNADRVLVDDPALKLARLALLSTTRQVLQNGLKLLGVSAPAKM